MSKYLKTKIWNTLIYFFCAILIEITTFAFLGFGFPKYFLLEFSVLLILSGLVFITPKRYGSCITALAFLLLQSTASFVNVMLFESYKDVFTLDMMTIGREAMTVFSFELVNVFFTIIVVLSLFVSAFFMFRFSKKTPPQKTTIKLASVLAGVFISMQVIATLGIVVDYTRILANSDEHNILKNDRYLSTTLFNKVDALSKFGSFGFYFFNFFNSHNENVLDASQAGTYFSNGEYSTKNEFTGLCEDKNLIMIMVESFAYFAASNEFLTPNLYSIFYGDGNLDYSSLDNYSDAPDVENTKGATAFTSYYSNNKTNITELISLLGSYTEKTKFSYNFKVSDDMVNNNFDFSLPQIFSNSGYTTSYFHNYLGSFYGREAAMPLIGFENFTDVYGMTENPSSRFGEWFKDSDMFASMMDKIVLPDQKFFSFLTTVSMHGGYTTTNYKKELFAEYYDKINYALENQELLYPNFPYDSEVQNSSYREYFINYQASVMDFDKAIGLLLERLENENLLDKTTIVMFADHMPYYHSLHQFAAGLTEETKYNPTVYNVPFAIIDSDLKNKLDSVADKDYYTEQMVTSFEFAPTILDLFGYSFNRNLYMGDTLFSDAQSYKIFVSYLSGYFNKEHYSINGREFVFPTLETSSLDFENYILQFYKRQDYFEVFYKQNVLINQNFEIIPVKRFT